MKEMRRHDKNENESVRRREGVREGEWLEHRVQHRRSVHHREIRDKMRGGDRVKA